MEESGYSFRNDIIDEEYRERNKDSRNVGNFPTCNPIGCLPNVWILVDSNIFDSGCWKAKEQIYIYKRKFFVQTRMTRFSKRPEIIYRVEACCESIHPWYRFHGRSGNGRLKQTTREMQFVHLSRCRKKLAARVNEHSSEYLAAACVYIDVEIGPAILAQVSATTIPLARFVSLEANRRKSVRSKLAWFLHANINSDKRTVARARYCTH